MVVTASNAIGGLVNEIFVYQRLLIGIGGGADQFTNVASPADILEYPISAPLSAEVPFFRLNYADLVFRNLNLADTAWAGIKGDVNELIQTLTYFEQLEVQEVAVFGSSSSSSSS